MDDLDYLSDLLDVEVLLLPSELIVYSIYLNFLYENNKKSSFDDLLLINKYAKELGIEREVVGNVFENIKR